MHLRDKRSREIGVNFHAPPHEVFSATVRKEMRMMRLREELSQGQLGERIGIWGSTVSDLENHDIRVGNLYRYADALGYDVEIRFTKREQEQGQEQEKQA